MMPLKILKNQNDCIILSYKKNLKISFKNEPEHDTTFLIVFLILTFQNMLGKHEKLCRSKFLRVKRVGGTEAALFYGITRKKCQRCRHHLNTR